MAETVPLKLTAAAALRMVRDLAAESSRIVILNHCRERMVQRNINRRQVELCLQKGTIVKARS
jgi:uncharacterized protein DUF4258